MREDWSEAKAFRALGLSGEESLAEVRSRYLSLVRRNHPDERGEAGPQSSRIGEFSGAYRYLALHWREREHRPAWPDPPDPALPFARPVYDEEHLWEDGPRWTRSIARGRFLWNPELEDFHLFLASLRSLPVRQDPDTLFALVFVYLDPWRLLEDALAGRDEEGKMLFRFGGRVGMKASPGEVLAPARLLREPVRSLIVKGSGGEAPLSFEEDWAFFALWPLFEAHCVKIRITCGACGGRKGARAAVEVLCGEEKGREVLAEARKKYLGRFPQGA